MKELEQLDEGTYRMRCMNLVETQLENPQFGNGDVIRFVLETTEVMDSAGNPVEMDAIANDILTPFSKLTRWLAAFGVSAEPGHDLDLEDCIDKQALVVVKHKAGGRDGKTMFARVDDIVPAPKTSRNGSTRPTEASMRANDDPDFTNFWKRTQAVGLSREQVLAAVQTAYPGFKIQDSSQSQLLDILANLGA